METPSGEQQCRHLAAAERLMRLSIDHGLAVTALLAALARELFELNLRHWEEIAAAEEHEALRLRAEHAGRVAGLLVGCAARLVELGGEVRSGFSRLLTEQLAAGNHDLMDAFQGFFAFLPAHGADLPQMLALAGERSGRALSDLEALLIQPVPAAADVEPESRKRRVAARLQNPPPAAAAILVAGASAA